MQNKQTSRDKILQSAVQLFLEEGFEATSVNDICKHAGVSKGSFYHYFETKQVLFLEPDGKLVQQGDAIRFG